jgi:hypothetical protein
MKILRSLSLIINYKTFLVAFLACLSTYLSVKYNLVADFQMHLVSVAIIFPVVFSISSAYQRREMGLNQLSILKGNSLSFYYAIRDWVGDNEAKEAKNIQSELFHTLKKFLNSVEHQTSKKFEKEIYYKFSTLSKLVKTLRENGLSGSEVTRIGQYHNNMIIAFKTIQNIFYYRTPISLRAYYRFFIYAFSILYGPYFAQIKESPSLLYIVPILFSAILVSLDNIQEHLERPYDEIGEDDIKIDVEEYLEYLD